MTSRNARYTWQSVRRSHDRHHLPVSDRGESVRRVEDNAGSRAASFRARRLGNSLAGIVERATSQSVRTVVAFLPSKESTYHRDYAELFGGNYLDNERVGFAHLATVAETAGAIAVDLTPTFRAHANEPLYFEVDAHFNAAGHALVASALRPILDTALAEESRQ